MNHASSTLAKEGTRMGNVNESFKFNLSQGGNSREKCYILGYVNLPSKIKIKRF